VKKLKIAGAVLVVVVGLAALGYKTYDEFNPKSDTQPINPQTQAQAGPLCNDAAEFIGVHLDSVEILPGVEITNVFDEIQHTDTVICHFVNGGTLPFTIFYDQAGDYIGTV